MTVPESNPDFSCPTCHAGFWWTGDTELARNRALRDWRGCCVPNAGHDKNCAVTQPARECTCEPVSPATTDDAAAGAPTNQRRFFSGAPSWVRRRIAHWPFDAPDYTT